MPKIEKPLAKSLHTVTVLVTVCRLYMDRLDSPEAAMTEALSDLGLAGKPDPYGLAAQALRLIAKGSK
jgi:hypothetical protein